MKHALATLTCALGLAGGCAPIAPRPLSLPPRTASVERRAAAYRARAVMPHMGFSGWGLRVGDGALRGVDEARPILANAAEAEAILHARDNQLTLGWTLFGVGMGVMLSSLVALPYTLGSRDDRSALIIPFTLVGVGAAIALPSAVVLGSAQRSVPTAAEAYNRWLWDALDLPRSEADAERAPPATAPSLPSPWQSP